MTHTRLQEFCASKTFENREVRLHISSYFESLNAYAMVHNVVLRGKERLYCESQDPLLQSAIEMQCMPGRHFTEN